VKTVPFPGAPVRTPRWAAGCALVLGLATLTSGTGALAQEKEKGAAAKPMEIYQQVRALVNEGRYDVAAIFLQSLVDSNPTDQDLLAIEAQYGSTVFKQLGTIVKWSDDPKVNAQAQANVRTLIKRATEATEKVLRNPARVTKYIRNLGETYEEREFAMVELRRTGDYAVPFMVDALRTNLNAAVSNGIIEAIPHLESQSMAGWVAALDGLPADRQFSVLSAISSRPDVLTLVSFAQTDFIPTLWKVVGDPTASPAFQKYARDVLEKLVPGATKKQPEIELAAYARKFADRKARFLGAAGQPDGTPTTVPVWVWDAATQKLVKQDTVPVGQADEYFGLRYARWALERQPDFEPAQVLVLTLATERAMDRGKFGELARTDPAVYRMLADAPTSVLTDLLGRGLAEKRTGLVLALTQALGDRADKAPALPAAGGKPSLLERALDYPDPRVQLAAANALLRSPVPVEPKLRGRVIEVLKRAAAVDNAVAPDTKGKALLADPNRQRADDAAALLRGLGYDVEQFGAGRDLLRRVSRASDFDLIVIDHHLPNPELLDVVTALRADVNVARRPILVVASLDQTLPPTVDQLLLRLALLIAATDTAPHSVAPPPDQNDPDYMPPPYVPDFRRTQTEEQREADRIGTQRLRDRVFAAAARSRIDRLQRVLATTGLELTSDQKFQVNLRVEQLTVAVLGVQFAMTADSSPQTYRAFELLQKQIRTQPYVPPYTRRVGVDQLMRLIERLETDVRLTKHAADRYEELRTKVDTDALGLVAAPTRNVEAEARVGKMLQNFTAIRVIPEPPSRAFLEYDINAAYQDPSDRPRDPAEKKAGSKLAVEWLSRMATGEVTGFDAKPAAPELILALRSDDTASPAIDAVGRIPTAGAQLGLLNLVLTGGRPLALRVKAAEVAVRHIQVNGKLVPQTITDAVATQAGAEQNAELRGKLLVLKGLLAPNPKAYVAELRSYSPPLVPPPAPMTPTPAPKGTEPEPKGKE
jgi:CheY-like chemotaxis protein